jgi:hypothetical protein
MRAAVSARDAEPGGFPRTGFPALLPDVVREADFVVAGAAVDGPIVPREKGNRRARSAIRAYHGMHLSRGSTRAFASPGCTATGAALRLVKEPFLSVEPLLASGENEVCTTFSASQGLVHELHLRPPCVIVGHSLVGASTVR